MRIKVNNILIFSCDLNKKYIANMHVLKQAYSMDDTFVIILYYFTKYLALKIAFEMKSLVMILLCPQCTISLALIVQKDFIKKNIYDNVILYLRARVVHA